MDSGLREGVFKAVLRHRLDKLPHTRSGDNVYLGHPGGRELRDIAFCVIRELGKLGFFNEHSRLSLSDYKKTVAALLLEIMYDVKSVCDVGQYFGPSLYRVSRCAVIANTDAVKDSFVNYVSNLMKARGAFHNNGPCEYILAHRDAEDYNVWDKNIHPSVFV